MIVTYCKNRWKDVFVRKFLFLFLFVVSLSTYAKETVKIIVPYTAGGLSDRLARQLQTYLTNDDYEFVVENRPGAGGLIGTQSIVDEKNKPMLLVSGQALVSNSILGHAKYDINNDFVFFSCLVSDTTVVVSNSNSDIKNFNDIRTVSSTVPYGTSGIGTVQHMVSPIVAGGDKKQVEITFKGTPEVMNALLSGTIMWYVDNLTIVAPMIDSGKFRILAASQKLKKYPDVPSFRELGINIHGFRSKQLFVANNNITPQMKSYIDRKLEDKKLAELLESLGYESCINTKGSGLKAEKELIEKLLR